MLAHAADRYLRSGGGQVLIHGRCGRLRPSRAHGAEWPARPSRGACP
jgi:hypothetical protein